VKARIENLRGKGEEGRSKEVQAKADEGGEKGWQKRGYRRERGEGMVKGRAE
jgi:hypothetical protein